ncbi:MAG: ABC transporter permease [Bryobacteraceae bacterium]
MPASCQFGDRFTLPGQYGPFDYRTATREQKEIVERRHFTLPWAAVQKGKLVWYMDGQYIGPVGADFDYTLRAFPNHYQALKAIDEVEFRLKNPKVPGLNWSVNCYFLRASGFRPDDGLVRALYGAYLARRGKAAQARLELDRATELTPNSINVESHVAWSYFAIGDWADAEKHARLAYEYGYALPGLRDKLKAKGHWSE